jgi:negative regulator of sigma E activity
VTADRATPDSTPHGTGWSLDQLADYAAGLLSEAEQATVDDALAQDDTAAHLYASLPHADDLVRGELRALPAVTMPADIAARIDAALAAEERPAGEHPAEQVAATVIPLRRRRWLTASGAVAAGVAVLAGAAFGIGQLTRSSSSSSSTAASGSAPRTLDSRGNQPKADGGADAVPSLASSLVATGVDYRKASLASQVTALVTNKADRPYTGGTKGFGVPSGLTQLAGTPGRIEDCLRLLGIAAPRRVDLAKYEGTPSVIVVSNADPGQLMVTVAGAECGNGGPDLTVRTTVSATR